MSVSDASAGSKAQGGGDRFGSAVRFLADNRGRTGMSAFAFKLELEDGTPADPSAFQIVVSSWQPG
jgi:hypothetical protein